VAVDGSKFNAVNNRDKNFTEAKMKQRLEHSLLTASLIARLGANYEF